MKKPIELYIHIPFCIHKCAYCDFPSRVGSLDEQEVYVKDLINKIEDKKNFAKNYQVRTLFVGGGTPTILGRELLCELLEKVHQVFDTSALIEATVEMNPKTANKDLLLMLKNNGINRLSIGLQSTIDEELRGLSRIHTFSDFLRSYEEAREVGFSNINIDLMSGIPLQTRKSWVKTLERVLTISPEHISAYSLIIEEGTTFFSRNEKGELILPDEESERWMYWETARMLQENGYHHYEISNYAKPGYECCHNLGYWEGHEYLGLGYKAASLLDNIRFVEGEEPMHLSKENRMEEFMFLGLRKTEGISRVGFWEEFQQNIDQVYGKVLKDMKEKGLLMEKNERIFLTEKGIDLSNYVMSEFLF